MPAHHPSLVTPHLKQAVLPFATEPVLAGRFEHDPGPFSGSVLDNLAIALGDVNYLHPRQRSRTISRVDQHVGVARDATERSG